MQGTRSTRAAAGILAVAFVGLVVLPAWDAGPAVGTDPGQRDLGWVTRNVDHQVLVTVHNGGNETANVVAQPDNLEAANVTVTPASFSLAPLAERMVTVTVRPDQSALPGSHRPLVRFVIETDGDQSIAQAAAQLQLVYHVAGVDVTYAAPDGDDAVFVRVTNGDPAAATVALHLATHQDSANGKQVERVEDAAVSVGSLSSIQRGWTLNLTKYASGVNVLVADVIVGEGADATTVRRTYSFEVTDGTIAKWTAEGTSAVSKVGGGGGGGGGGGTTAAQPDPAAELDPTDPDGPALKGGSGQERAPPPTQDTGTASGPGAGAGGDDDLANARRDGPLAPLGRSATVAVLAAASALAVGLALALGRAGPK